MSVQLDQEKSILDFISNVGTVGLTGGSLVVLDGDGSFLQRYFLNLCRYLFVLNCFELF